jgi:hypothetical protein
MEGREVMCSKGWCRKMPRTKLFDSASTRLHEDWFACDEHFDELAAFLQRRALDWGEDPQQWYQPFVLFDEDRQQA